MGVAVPVCSNPPGHNAELAADAVGLLCGAQQLRGAALVRAVLGNEAAKSDKHLPGRGHVPGTGDELLLALKQNRNVVRERRRKQTDPFLARQEHVERPGVL